MQLFCFTSGIELETSAAPTSCHADLRHIVGNEDGEASAWSGTIKVIQACRVATVHE